MKNNSENRNNDVLVVIYDKKAEVYSSPILFVNEATAVRHFNGMLDKYKEDYDLYSIGYYDSKFASITLFENKHFICNLGEFNVKE